jgi:hypothetical protein
MKLNQFNSDLVECKPSFKKESTRLEMRDVEEEAEVEEEESEKDSEKNSKKDGIHSLKKSKPRRLLRSKRLDKESKKNLLV